VGVRTNLGNEILADAVVLTNGTFLNGKIHIGEKNFGGGRTAEESSDGLTEQFTTLGFESGRMKTGTPPRIDGEVSTIQRWKNNLATKTLGNSPIRYTHLIQTSELLDYLY
jgi:tRNA U34 5-carboxymethylaminomethyl modifying enzyme MnmG/GidA